MALDRPVVSALYGQVVEVSVLLDRGGELDAVDLSLIVEVVGDLDSYLIAALDFVRTMMLADPATSGVPADQVGRYQDVAAEDVPLDLPQLLVYSGTDWTVHFQDGRLPVCTPHGLAVVFDRLGPARVEILTDAEPTS